MSIHEKAVTALGARARIEKWRSEVLEKLFAIDRYLEGKATPEEVISEHYDDLFVSQSLAHIPEFAALFNEREQARHRIGAEEKLKVAMKEVRQ